MKFWIAQAYFFGCEFHAFGKTEQKAKRAMRKALLDYAKAYGVWVDADKRREFRDDVATLEVELDSAYVDISWKV